MSHGPAHGTLDREPDPGVMFLVLQERGCGTLWLSVSSGRSPLHRPRSVRLLYTFYCVVMVVIVVSFWRQGSGKCSFITFIRVLPQLSQL